MEEWRMHFVLMKKWNYYEEKMILFWIFIFLIFIQICNGSQSLKFTIEPADVSVSEGSSILLPCEGIASIGKSKEKIQPNIRWRGPDGQDIGIVGDTFRTQLANGSLYISAIEENRGLTGSYQCLLSVEGIGTIVSRFTRVSIAQPPETDNLFRVINLFVGQTAYFNCLTKPMPPFDIQYDIQWLKDDAPLRFDESRMIISPTGAIEIDAVKLSDSGTYHCNVTLGLGLHQSKLSSKSILTVNSTTNEIVQALQAPIFLTETSAQIVREGDTITLDCVANGNPRPQLKWLRNGEEIDISDLDSRYHINGIGSLQITAIEENDAGNYICRAKNHIDSSDIQVSVQVQVPPKFIESPKDKKAHVKDEIEFVCEIHGKPTPVIQWLKNGDVITPNEYLYIVGGHNLRIAGLLSADAGMFQCIGSNPAGSVQASAWLQIEDTGSSAEVHAPLPGPPRDLIAQIVNPRFVALSWMEPIKNPDEILSYTVYYKMSTSDRERKITTKGDDQMANIQSLLPGKTYQFRVVGNSNYGPGESSNVYEVHTQSEENIVGAPHHFNGTVLSHNEIWLTWDLPILNNMNITKYRVSCTDNDGNEMHKDSIEMDAVLGDLRPYTEYTISVAAFNQNGMGDPSNEILLKTFSAIPSEPPFNVTLETTSATSITVRWEPPPIEEQNGQITGYKIRYRRQKKPLQYETTPANVRHYELKGLDKMSAYQVKISAMTINGTGPFTEWIHIETYENDLKENQVPGAPAWIKTRAGTGSITVTWASPSAQEIKVRGYVLGWGLGIPDVDTYELDENARSYTMKELIPNSEYVISIRARNLIGDGPPQYDTVRTRDDEPYELSGALEVPVGLRAMTMTSSSIVVYWTDTTLNRNQKVTDNRYYVVRYNTLESERNRKFYNVTDLNCMIDNLKPNTKYEFAVKVVKGRRESPYSMSVINSTFTTSLISAPRDLFAQPDETNPQNIILEWLPPKHSNGLINGYIIFYTTDITKRDRDWQVDAAIGGDLHTIIIRNLLPHTMYYFKVQARAIKGSNGPFSTMVSQMTGYMAGGGGGMGQPPHTKQTGTSSSFLTTLSNNIIYIIIAITILTIVIASIVVTILCRRKPPNTPEHSKLSYQKNNAGIKPPDLWIHHDQMELKNIEKNHNNTPGCSDGASSSGAMTLPRSVQGHDYDAEQAVVGTTQITNSLDKRSYVPGYMTTSMNSTMERGQYPRTQYNNANTSNRQIGGGGGHTDPTNISQQNLHQIQQQQQQQQLQQQQLQQNPNAITTQTSENAYGYDSMPSNYSNPSVTYAPGLSIDAPKRGQGHPLKSFSVPGPPAIVAPLHIAQVAKHPVPTVTIRPQNSSPYKKPTLNTLPNRLQVGPSVAHSNDEIQRLAPSNSTEELNQEMANLEGLMKDLSAITANEFEC